MKDDLKKALLEIQNEMIQEDLNKEKNSPPLDENFTEKFYKEINMSDNEQKNISNESDLNENKRTKRKGKIIKGPWQWKKLASVAAAFLLVASSLLFLPKFLPNYSKNNVEKFSEAPGYTPPRDEMKEESKGTSPEVAKESKAESSPETPAEDKGLGDNNSIPTLPTIPEKSDEKIIYHFYYTIQTTDYEKTDKTLKELMAKTNSYIEDGNVSQSSNNTFNADYTVRVPKDKSAQFQKDMASLGTVTYQSVSTENKTQNYKDMESYKKTLEIREKKLQELLEKAEKMEDIIMINNELSTILSEKENLTRELDQIDHDVDYQYFSLSISEVKKPDTSVGAKGGFLNDLSKAFTDSLEGITFFFSMIILSIVRYWYLVVLTTILASIIYRFLRKRK